MLRGYESLPDSVSNDIDLAIDPDQINAFEKISHEFLVDRGFTRICRMDKFQFVQLYYYSKILKQSLHLDFKYGFTYRGMTYLDITKVLKNRIPLRMFFIPSPEDELATSFLKEYNHNQGVRKDKIGKLKSLLNNVENKNVFEDYYCKQSPEFIKAISEDIYDLKKLGRRNYLKLFSKNIRRQGFFTTIGNSLGYLRKEFRLFRNPPGKFISLLGPDGSGKTTSYEMIAEEIGKHFYSNVTYYHFRYGKLPPISRLMGRKQVKNVERTVEENLKEAEKTSRFFFLYPIYYFFDFLMGSFDIRYKKYKNHLVVYDRYYYDYIVNQAYKKLPRFFMWPYKWFIIKPDVLIYLKADADVIFNRKPELPVYLIKYQQEKITQDVIKPKLYKSLFTLETGIDLKESANSTVDFFIDHVERKN